MYLRMTSARLLGAVLLIGAAALTGCSDSGGGDTAGTPDAAASANGLEDVSADEILTEVISSLNDASSVHITGELDNQGSPLTIDMTLSGDGSGSSSGTLTVNDEANKVVSVGEQTWVAPPDSYWTSKGISDTDLADYSGKFIAVPTTDTSLSVFTDFSGLVTSLSSHGGDVTKGDQSTVGGVPVIELIDSKDKGVLSVSLQGDALPLKTTSKDGQELLLSDWNEPLTVAAPADTDVVDLSTLPTPSPTSSQ